MLHSLWFHYVVPSLQRNGASMALGALFLPLVKKYLKSEAPHVPGRLRAAAAALWGALRGLLRLRVTVAPPRPKAPPSGPPTSPQAPQAGTTMAAQ